MAPGILDIHGVGPVTAAIILAEFSHHGRVRSEAAFAAPAGASPIPASSGNTNRYRLNRYGDRQLNRVMDVIVRTRSLTDPATRAYIRRSTADKRARAHGKSAVASNASSPDSSSANYRHLWLDSPR